MVLLKYNEEGRAEIARILKKCAENDFLIEISENSFIIEKDKQYICRRLSIKGNCHTFAFMVYYITEKLYQKMLEREVILKIEDGKRGLSK